MSGRASGPQKFSVYNSFLAISVGIVYKPMATAEEIGRLNKSWKTVMDATRSDLGRK